MDSLPPSDPAVAAQEPPVTYAAAPGDIYARNSHEADLCRSAAHPDWFYLGGLLALDAGSVWFGSSTAVKYAKSEAVRLLGPSLVGLTWGASVGGAWLALPKCSQTWVGESPREGGVRTSVPVAVALAVLAGVTAPVINGVAVGPLPTFWSTTESEIHLVAAGIAGFTGALLPYFLPPRTWAASRELEHLRVEVDGRGNPFVGFIGTF